ncbi:MAG: ABC transporter ATP-binding protein [Bacillota bacterium]|nr:ABC transporter ATP-binding protein [Bacillota bacterium]
MADIIATSNLCRYFETGSEVVKALQKVNITVKKGSLTILRGRSGSGKTTLINILGAMDRPTEGNVFFDERDITGLTDFERDDIRRKDMGFVFQSGALIGNMSAYENVEFGLRISGFETKERKVRAIECLNMVGLGKRMNHRPGELSGGEQQRVAIARAVAHMPKIVFADEPTSALDTTMGIQVVKIFRDLVQNHGLTVVMTTHDPSMMEIADQVYTLRDGETVNE